MKLSELSGRLWRFGAVGVAQNAVCYGAFLILLARGVRPVRANAACYLVGLLLSYAGNRGWAFRSDGPRPHAPDLARFAAAHGAGFTASIAAMTVLTSVMPPALAQVGAVLTAAVVIFAMLQLLGFGRVARMGAVR